MKRAKPGFRILSYIETFWKVRIVARYVQSCCMLIIPNWNIDPLAEVVERWRSRRFHPPQVLRRPVHYHAAVPLDWDPGAT